MKNPWKKVSKVNPQRENGNRQVSSEVFNTLVRTNLSGGEFRVCLAIIGQTWGFHKKSDIISIKQICTFTGLANRSVKTILKQLKDKRIICCQQSEIKKNGSFLNEYLFNKYYDTWQVSNSSLVSNRALVNNSALVSNRALEGKESEEENENQLDINKTGDQINTSEQSSTSEQLNTSQVSNCSPGQVSNCSPTKESIKENIQKKNTIAPSSGAEDIFASGAENKNLVSEPTTTQAVEDTGKKPAKGRQTKKKANPDVKIFFEFAEKTYLEKFGDPLVIRYDIEGNNIKKLLKIYTLARLKELWIDFLDSDDDFILRAGHGVNIFISVINKFTSGKSKKTPESLGERVKKRLIEKGVSLD